MLSLVYSMFLFEQQKAVYGPAPYVHGLGKDNRRVVDMFVRYAYEQGYITRPIPVEELFARETLA